MIIKVPYTCPCCGYTTPRKDDMRYHLYRKRLCPQTQMILELTEEIKTFILANRIYRMPVAPIVTNIQTINNYNQVTNFINQMDIMEKVDVILEHKGIAPKDVMAKMESDLQVESSIISGNREGFHLDEFSELIKRLCTSDDLSEISIVYTVKTDQLHIFDNKTWTSMQLKDGTRRVIQIFNENFLGEYERYLIKQRDVAGARQRQFLMEKLLKLYSLLVAFELEPYVLGKIDDDILDNNSSSHECEDMYMKIFRRAEKELVLSEKNKLVKHMNDVVKGSSKAIGLQLNKAIIQILECDKGFAKEKLCK